MRRSQPHKLERLSVHGTWVGIDLNPIDIVSDVASSAEDAWNTAVDAVPGARAVADAVDSVVTGPVRDFAHTAIGQTMFTALASSLTGGLAPLLGPQLATVAFALPGLAKGEDFVTSWTQEFASRVKQTAAILGDQAAADLANHAFDQVSQWIQKAGLDIDWSKVDFHALAKQLGIREDFTDLAIAGATGDLTDYLSRNWDAKTGKEIPRAPSFAEQMATLTRKIAQQAAARAAQQQWISSQKRGMLSANVERVSDVVARARATGELPPLPVAPTTETVRAPDQTPPPGFWSSLSPGMKVLTVGGAGAAAYGLFAVLRALR